MAFVSKQFNNVQKPHNKPFVIVAQMKEVNDIGIDNLDAAGNSFCNTRKNKHDFISK